MHHISSLLSKFFLSSSNFKNFVPDSVRIHHLSSLLSKFLNGSNFKNIVPNSVKIHHLSSLLLKFSQQFQLPKYPFESRQSEHFSVLVIKNGTSGRGYTSRFHRQHLNMFLEKVSMLSTNLGAKILFILKPFHELVVWIPVQNKLVLLMPVHN